MYDLKLEDVKSAETELRKREVRLLTNSASSNDWFATCATKAYVITFDTDIVGLGQTFVLFISSKAFIRILDLAASSVLVAFCNAF